MTTAATEPIAAPRRRFDNAAEWLNSLGGVPPRRILFDPLPGAATEADLLGLVERGERLCELIDGTLVEKPAGIWEGLIAGLLVRYLWDHVGPRGLGAVFGDGSPMRMRAGRVRLPDVSFVSRERMPTTLAPVPDLAPDLAVEVLSDANAPAEMQQKLREYFESGTRLAWLIDPRTRTVAVHHAPGEPTRVIDEAGTLDGEAVVPGFTLAVSELFSQVPREGEREG